MKMLNNMSNTKEAIEQYIKQGKPKNFAKLLAEAFCKATLPKSVCADQIATFPNEKNRTGTNLMTVVEAQDVFENMLINLNKP